MSASGEHTAARPLMTLGQQADFIEYLIGRCSLRDGATAGETWTLLTTEEVKDLRALEKRLRRLAPHENEIRRLVTGK